MGEANFYYFTCLKYTNKEMSAKCAIPINSFSSLSIEDRKSSQRVKPSRSLKGTPPLSGSGAKPSLSATTTTTASTSSPLTHSRSTPALSSSTCCHRGAAQTDVRSESGDVRNKFPPPSSLSKPHRGGRPYWREFDRDQSEGQNDAKAPFLCCFSSFDDPSRCMCTTSAPRKRPVHIPPQNFYRDQLQFEDDPKDASRPLTLSLGNLFV